MDCSKTEVFFTEWERICRRRFKRPECELVTIGIVAGCSTCEENICSNFKKAIEIIQEWSDNNSIKTRQSEFLKMFEAAQQKDDVLTICPYLVDTTVFCQKHFRDCSDCRREYWLAEVE